MRRIQLREYRNTMTDKAIRLFEDEPERYEDDGEEYELNQIIQDNDYMDSWD